MGKRLFVAVDVDDLTREAVDRLTCGLREQAATERLGRMSWVTKDRMHLTLHFSGDADAASERALLDALRHLAHLAVFDIAFGGLGVFPERGAPRVFWLGISKGLEQLRAIHSELNRWLPSAERSPETFSPHLTLARFRDRVPRRAVAEISAFPAAAGPSRIDRVTLYESRLSPKGPTYTAVAEAPLKAPS